MPQQTPEDDYNCGIGVEAGVGIILRYVIGTTLSLSPSCFSKKMLIVSFCKKTKECVCSFPEDTFQTLPPS
jgi:hypothetical protein